MSQPFNRAIVVSFLLISTLIASGVAIAETTASRGLTDSQAIGYIISSNNGQVELSKLAKAKSQNKDVKSFADHMIKVHVDRTVEFLALAQKIGAKSETSADTKLLEAALASDKSELSDERGPQLDKTFLKQEIDHHQKVISEIKTQLLASVKSAELKETLSKMLPRITQNLDKAQSILNGLK